MNIEPGSVRRGRLEQPDPQPRRPIPLLLLALVFALEAVGLVAVLVLLVLQIAAASGGTDLPSALAIAVLTAFGVLVLVLLARGAMLRRSWVRSAGIVWQIVQLFIGLAAFQGAGAQPVLGSIVAVPALAGLVLLFTPAVRTALRRPDPTPPPAPPARKRR